MADDVAITAGSGTTIATDEVSTKHYQRVKLTDGTADSATAIAAGGGTEATALRVTVATDSTGVLSVDDNGSTLSIDDGGGSITVDGILIVFGSTAEDANHVSGDAGFFSLSVRQSEANSLTSTAGSDGDYAAFNTDARGLLQVVARPYVTRQRQASSGLTTAATAYSIGDTAGAIMTFTSMARVSGGTGTILSAVLLDKGDVGTDYRLHIYRSSVSLAADNAAWAVSDADQQELIGIVTMPSMLDVGANRVTTLSNIGLPYDCAATSLFVGIETRSANAVYAAATDLNLILTVALD